MRLRVELQSRLGIDGESAGTGEVQLAVEAGAGGKGVGGGERFESGVRDGGYGSEGEGEVAFTRDLVAEGLQAVVDTEDYDAGSAESSQEKNGGDTCDDLTHDGFVSPETLT